MHYLLGLYMWIYIHRPFEISRTLGDLQFERVYMLLMVVAWAVLPGKRWQPNRLHLALGAFLAVMLLAWLASPFADRAETVIETYLKVAVFYVLLTTSVHTEKDLKKILTMYLLAMAAYVGHSLLEYANGRHVYRMGITRLIGVDATYGDPNSLAYSLILSLGLTAPFWKTATTWPVRLALFAYCGMAVVSVLLTGSRAGFIGLILTGLVAVLLSGRRKGAVLLVGGAVVLVCVLLPGPLQNRFMTLIDSSAGPDNALASAEGRLGGFLAGLELWAKSPLLGYGPVAFFADVTGSGHGAHNMYAQLLTELGALGALAFGFVVFCFLRNWREAHRLCRHLPRPPAFALAVVQAVAVTVLVALVMGWAGHNLFRYTWQWLAAFQVIAVGCVRAAARAEVAPVPRVTTWVPRRRARQQPA